MKKLFFILLLPAILFASLNEERVTEAQRFCKKSGYNNEYAIFINMAQHSGKKRFYLYSFAQKRVLLKALVSHGCGKEEWAADHTKESPVFSNTPQSHCSSLGKYRIGKRGYSNWGINVNYKLHGLETSNSNAYKRVIVLHSWSDIPDMELFPAGTPEGWGCPSVSNRVMEKLDRILKVQQKPVLLWIFK